MKLSLAFNYDLEGGEELSLELRRAFIEAGIKSVDETTVDLVRRTKMTPEQIKTSIQLLAVLNQSG